MAHRVVTAVAHRLIAARAGDGRGVGRAGRGMRDLRHRGVAAGDGRAVDRGGLAQRLRRARRQQKCQTKESLHDEAPHLRMIFSESRCPPRIKCGAGFSGSCDVSM